MHISMGEDKDIPITELKYDYNEINKFIVDEKPPVKTRAQSLIGQALYSNYIYQLCVLEFINFTSKERNFILREKINKILTKTPANKISISLDKLEELNDNDRSRLRKQLIQYGVGKENIANLRDAIESAIYNFDNITINRVLLGDKKLLKNILEEITELSRGHAKDIKEFPNIYAACENEKQEYCVKKRLIIDTNIITFDEIMELLYTDIHNPIKQNYLRNGNLMNNTIDYFKFTSYPDEIITIT